MKIKKRRWLSLVLGLMAMVLTSSVGEAGEWLEGSNGYARGIEASTASGKPLVLYVYTDWCPFCRKFENNILEKSSVKSALKNFVKVRVNPDKGSREVQIAQKYKVRGYPSVYFVDVQGGYQVMDVGSKTRSVNAFKKAAEKFMKKVGEGIKTQNKLEDVPLDAPIKEPTIVKDHYTLHLKNGRQVKGVLISRDQKGVTLGVDGLGEVYFSDLEFNKLEKIK